jgi:hypothetical protein
MKKHHIAVPFGHNWAGTKEGSCRQRLLGDPYRRASRHQRPPGGRYSAGAFDLQTHLAFVKMPG